MSQPYLAPRTVSVDERRSVVPPPGGRHLLIFAALFAAHLALVQIMVTVPLPFWPVRVFQLLVWAAQLTGLWALVENRKVEKRILRQPGHWLLFIQVVSTLLSLVYVIPSFFPQLQAALLWSATTKAVGLVPASLFAWAAVRNRSVWRVLFAVSALALVLETFTPWLFRLGANVLHVGTASLLPQVLICFYAGMEPLSKDRDWMHWLGIGAMIVHAAVLVFWIFATQVGWTIHT